MASLQAGRDAWFNYDEEATGMTLEQLYMLRESLYNGTAFSTALKRSGQRLDPQLYRGTKLLWKNVNAIVTFYAMTVYQGDLSTDGSPLPGGNLGAIPILPQTGSTATDQQLLAAIAELNSAWNWRQQMTQIPERTAALGDLLTELVDQAGSPMVYPSFVWPGYVKDIELDHVSNVKSYTLQFWIEEEAPGKPNERYLFRKVVDNNTISYFRGSSEETLRPFDYNGNGEVIEHGYGFCPAVWDRHKVGWGVRGEAAIDNTRSALMELNSLLSHGKHFQHKAFSAPIIVKGAITPQGQTQVNLSRPPKDEMRAAQSTEWIQGDDNADIVQPKFDIGQTLEMVNLLIEGVQIENPEAQFYRELRGMTQVTGPGAERLLGDAVGRARLARAGHDAQMVKRYQMAIAMCGHRANLPEKEGGWPKPLTRRQAAFQPFNLDSYAEGNLDFVIQERPVVLPTKLELIQEVRQKEMVQSRWGLEEIGIEKDDIDRILTDRVESQWRSINGGSYADLMSSQAGEE